jgi:hypothetical protein
VHFVYFSRWIQVQNDYTFFTRYVAKIRVGLPSSFRCGRGRSRTSPTNIFFEDTGYDKIGQRDDGE